MAGFQASNLQLGRSKSTRFILLIFHSSRYVRFQKLNSDSGNDEDQRMFIFMCSRIDSAETLRESGCGGKCGARLMFAGLEPTALSFRAFPPSSASADEHELLAVFPNRRRFHALASHWCARRTSPAPPGGLKPDTVGGGCPVGADVMVRGQWRPHWDYNSQQPSVLFSQLIRASVGK